MMWVNSCQMLSKCYYAYKDEWTPIKQALVLIKCSYQPLRAETHTCCSLVEHRDINEPRGMWSKRINYIFL